MQNTESSLVEINFAVEEYIQNYQKSAAKKPADGRYFPSV